MAKLLFVQKYNGPLSGITSITSYLKKRHEVKLALGSDENINEKLCSFRPDVVGIYGLSIDHNWILKLARQIKSAHRSLILIGGPHATFYPDIIEDSHIDAICIGEGENPVLTLLDRIDDSKDYADIRSLWVKKSNRLYKNEIGALLKPEEIPVPDIGIYDDFPDILSSESLGVVCSRGCLFNCNFCGNYTLRKMYKDNFFRVRKIDDIIEEIERAKKVKNIKVIIFQDDIFGIDKKWLKDFLKQYNEKIKLPFYCLLRCDLITEDLIDQLKDAGCFRVGVGIESGCEDMRNKVLGKRLSDATIEKSIKILRDKDVKFHTFNMFGLPEEDYSSALKTLELNIKLKPDPAKSLIFQPLPGTKFFSKDIEKSILSPDFSMFKINHSYHKDSAKIQRLQKLFMLIVRFPFLKHLLPILVRLPFDKLYDRLSRLCWDLLYIRKIEKGT
ncbi:B12-binding domain-containing radical SAM protein [Candidatus Omnitrophota bacterium]